MQILYPACCHACGRPPGDESLFCETCRASFLADPFSSCPRCAATVGPFSVRDGSCTHCRDATLHFDTALRLGPYDGALRDAVLRMKNHSGEALAELLGELWAEHAAEALRGVADVIVPVPLHWRRRWRRGYNQSEALSRGVASRLRLPCRPQWLNRVRATPMQTAQTLAGRRDNVRGAFRSSHTPRLAGAAVLLVDDVMTTGATASEAARALKSAGAGRVVAAALARAHG